jgi:hypothetical protein
VEVAVARAVLGLGPAPSWSEVRAAYRATMRRTHPDLAGGTTARATEANVAYATLVRARRHGRLHEPAPDRAPSPAPAPGPARERPSRVPVPAEVLDGDTIHLPVPPDEAFLLVLEACHRIGDVTYVDRSCAILETLLEVEGEGVCSLVVTFQGRAHGTEAFCTLEAIEHVASPPVHHVVAALVEALEA